MKARVGTVLAVGALLASLFPYPALAANSLTVMPLTAPLGTERTLRASGDFVEAHWDDFFKVLLDGQSANSTCEKIPGGLLGQDRVVCTFGDRGAPGHHTVRLVATAIGGDVLHPQTADIFVTVSTTTTAVAPTTTTPAPTTTSGGQPPPTQPAPTTTAGISDLTTTTLVATTATTEPGTTTTTASQSPSSTNPPLAAEEPTDSGGPSWLTVGLIAALAVAITVIVMQNLPRSRRDGD